jgi:hypothetical protein
MQDFDYIKALLFPSASDYITFFALYDHFFCESHFEQLIFF